jgi:hypothetical protein
MRVLPTLALAVLLITPLATRAAECRLTMHQRFERANTTHDGRLTEAQAKTGLISVARHFDAIDKDHRGYVTEADIHAYDKSRRHSAPRMTMHERFEHANTTHDGHLTEAQAKLGMIAVARHFEAIDKGRKGYVTEADIQAYDKRLRADRRCVREATAAKG